MQHLDEGTIHAWLDDALGGEEAARIAAHVEGCALCAARVAEARGLIAGASRIVGSLDEGAGDVMPTFAPAHPRFEPTAAPRRRRLIVPSAIAATLIVAAGSLLVTRHTPGVDVGVQRGAPSVTPPAAAPSASVPAAQAESAAAPATRVAAGAERRVQQTKPMSTPKGQRTDSPKAQRTDSAPAVWAPLPAAPVANVAEAQTVHVDSVQLRARARELSSARDQTPSRRAAAGLAVTDVVVTGLSAARSDARTQFRTAAGATAAKASVADAAMTVGGGCYELTLEQVDAGSEAPKLPARLVLMPMLVGDSARRGFLVTSVRDDGARVPEPSAFWRAIGERGLLTWPASPEPLTMSFNLVGESRAWLGAPGGTAVPVTVRSVRCR